MEIVNPQLSACRTTSIARLGWAGASSEFGSLLHGVCGPDCDLVEVAPPLRWFILADLDCIVIESGAQASIEIFESARLWTRIILVADRLGTGEILALGRAGVECIVERSSLSRLGSLVHAAAAERNQCARRASRRDLLERIDSLTTRERQVMVKIFEGQTTKQIAGELRVTPQAIDAHRKNILRKMRVDNVVQYIHMVYKLGCEQFIYY